MSLLRQTSCKTPPSRNWESFSYLNKGLNTNERTLVGSYWDELIGRYGVTVEYYPYNYSTALTGHDYLYGEQPIANFSAPVEVTMMPEMQNDAILLSKFGIESNADVTLVVKLERFAQALGANVEPKSGDVIRIPGMGWDANEVAGYGTDAMATSADILDEICRFKDPNYPASIIYPPTANSEGEPLSAVWIRCPNLFEVTERRHQDFQMGTNTLMGHYIWVIRAKRFEYSYQPGIDPECFMGDVGEETQTGIISGGTQDVSDPKEYPGNVEDDSNNNIWDEYDGKDAVYGSY